MDTIKSLLPQSEGILPIWLLIVSGISFANSLQCYKTTKFTQRVYCGSKPLPDTKDPYNTRATRSYEDNNPGVTALSSRTFGTWTFLTGITRLYAAYRINDPAWYQIALWGYAIALGHFALEWKVYGSTRWGPGLMGPFIVSTSSLVWMLTQWGFYVN